MVVRVFVVAVVGLNQNLVNKCLDGPGINIALLFADKAIEK